VSQLNQHIGPKAIPQNDLPLTRTEGYIKIKPASVLETRALLMRDEIITMENYVAKLVSGSVYLGRRNVHQRMVATYHFLWARSN
jgi:hypothetical protein